MSTDYLSVLPTIPSPAARDRILAAALSGLSENSCRAYTRHLRAFFAWLEENRMTLHREAALGYLEAHYRHDTASYNQALSAIKRLAEQAAENDWLSWHIARAIDGIASKKLRGTRSGNWLTLDAAHEFLRLPPDNTLMGKRDRAVLALLLGCGLRRDECARLEFDQLQMRDGRAVIENILGKGNRIRSVALPEWADEIVKEWVEAARISHGSLLRSFKSDGRLNGTLSASAIWDIVQHYAAQLAIACTPHDLRRTYAKLARKAGAPIETIQHSLGHASVATTEKYMRTGEEANAGDWISL